MMENDIFNIPMDMTGRNPIVEDGISSLTTANSLGQSHTCHLNNQNQTMSGYSLLSALEADTLASRSMPLGRNALRDASLVSSNSNFNTEFQEQISGGTPISATALATLLSTRSGLHEDLNDIAVFPSSVFPTKVLGTYVPNSTTRIPNSSLAATANSGYDGVNCDTNNKWDFDKFFVPPELGGKPSERAKFQPIQFMGNMDQNGWISSNNANVTTNNSHTYSTFSNELSLSLGTSQPSIFYETAIPVGCSEISCSGLTRCCLNETVLPLDQTSCNSKDLSLAPFRPDQFSQVISGSKYNRVIQDILTEIASYSLENIDKRSHSTGGVNIPFSSSFPAERGDSVMSFDESTNEDRRVVQMESALQREAKKTQLLALLQVVDDRYNQCSNEIHTVISAFHAATELDPQIHARFALQTISLFYKNLRDRISNQLIAMGGNFESGCTTGKDEVFETSFAPKQWALQQLRGKDHPVWRPQRGLPERSVSVLRAWMFQNFLHPYPKDAEKHLLAVRSGLTRSQVSNWFINARVRLWKPMIDEMYSEMNGRKALEGTDNSCKTHISIQDQRYRMS